MKNRGMLGSILVVLVALGLNSNSQAGVVLVDSQGSETFISEGKLKEVASEEEQVMIFDVNRSLVTMVDDAQKAYAQGTVDQFCSELSGVFGAAMEGMSDEEKAMMQQFMAGGGRQQPTAPPRVEVTKEGGGGTVAGLNTIKYRVTVNGAPYEDIWLTDDSTIMKEFDSTEKLAGMITKMTGCVEQGMGMGPSSTPEGTPQYQELFRKGFPVKIISYEGGSPTEDTNIIRVEKRSLPDEEFLPPKGYRKLSLSELMQSQM